MEDAKKSPGKKRLTEKRWFSVAYMFVITLVCTSALSAVYGLNKKRIAVNDKVRLQRIILKVFDFDVAKKTPADQVEKLFTGRIIQTRVDGQTIYTAHDASGQVKGYAFNVSGPGFWGQITGMMAVSENLETVVGMAFYEHSETPGLGGRIEEKAFTGQFKGKSLEKKPGQKAFFVFRPPETPLSDNQVHAITGATQTSTRVEAFLTPDIENSLARIKRLKEQNRTGDNRHGNG